MKSYKASIVINALGIVLLVATLMTKRWLLAPASVALILGGTLNLIVCKANGYKFPVVLHKGESLEQNPHYVIADTNTKLAWLADKYRVGKHSYSLGDICLSFSVILSLIALFM